MKKFFLIPICGALVFAACSTDSTTQSPQNTTDQGAVAGPLPEPANSPSTTTTTTPPPAAQNAPAPVQENNQPVTPPPPATPSKTDYPKGIPVAGKPGYVLSPYAQYAGLVDVTGYPSGTIVSCPFTHKKFVVP